MKFLLIVLAIHFLAELVAGKIRREKTKGENEADEKILHPAEYDLR